jgi:hypothetical protein
VANARDQAGHLIEAEKVEQVRASHLRFRRSAKRIVSATHGDSCVGSIGVADDEVRVSSPTDIYHRDLLADQRMEGMRNGDKSRRW